MELSLSRTVTRGWAIALIALALAGCASSPSLSALAAQHTTCPRIDYIQAAWSPDGTRIAFIAQRSEAGSSSSFELYTMTSLGQQPRLLHSDNASMSWVAWSPGTQILYSSELTLYAVDPDGSNLHSPNVAFVETASWSPDGKRFAFTRASDPAGLSIGIADADGSHALDLGKGDAPIFSPDGTRLLLTLYDRAGRPQVAVENTDATHLVQLTTDPDNNGPADWSPDGTRIAFASNRAGPTSDVYLMRSDGSQLTRLTSTGDVTSTPAWSPLGDKIAFVSNHGGVSDIYTVNVDGSGLTRLTQNPGGGICLH